MRSRKSKTIFSPREVCDVPDGPPPFVQLIDHAQGETMLYQQGQYIMAFEAEDTTHLEKVALLRKLLDNLYQNLQPVLMDLKSPARSSAYNTFVYDEANVPFLTALFTNITTGAVVYPHTDPPQNWAPYSPTAAPVFWSVASNSVLMFSRNDGQVVDAYTECNSTYAKTAFSVQSSENPNPIIVICPYFYNAPATEVFGDLPPASVDGEPASNCLEMNTETNRFKRKVSRRSFVGFELTMYRMWVLLEELAHKYYHAATGVDGKDVYNVNKASRLSPQDALANGPSYLYYAASGSSISSLKAQTSV